MEHVWTVVCQLTSEDRNTHAFSMINALEGIQFAADSAQVSVDDIVIPINFHLATTWWSEDPEDSDENQVQVRLFSPEREDLGGPDLEIAFGDSPYSRFTVNIQGFPYKGDGVYKYIVFHVLNDQPVEVQQIPIKVERIPFQELESPESV